MRQLSIRWVMGQVLNLDLSSMSRKARILMGGVSCGVWALATFFFGRVVLV